VELGADAHSLPVLIANSVRSTRLADARRHAKHLLEIFPAFQASHSHDLFPIRSPEFHERLVEALREAGIPQ